jgi:hypothetical protein
MNSKLCTYTTPPTIARMIVHVANIIIWVVPTGRYAALVTILDSLPFTAANCVEASLGVTCHLAGGSDEILRQ